MQSIKHTVTDEFEVKHSTFITYLSPVSDVETAKGLLASIKAEHPGAAHHCMAYVIGETQEIQKADDDGEPTKTAGVPILDVLKKNDLTDVLCVVVRYFGGVKLGAGGLIRAYASGASAALEKATRVTKRTFLTYAINVDFNHIGTIEHILEGETLLSREYTHQAIYTVEIEQSREAPFIQAIKEATRGHAGVAFKECTKRYTRS